MRALLSGFQTFLQPDLKVLSSGPAIGVGLHVPLILGFHLMLVDISAGVRASEAVGIRESRQALGVTHRELKTEPVSS